VARATPRASFFHFFFVFFFCYCFFSFFCFFQLLPYYYSFFHCCFFFYFCVCATVGAAWTAAGPCADRCGRDDDRIQ